MNRSAFKDWAGAWTRIGILAAGVGCFIAAIVTADWRWLFGIVPAILTWKGQ